MTRIYTLYMRCWAAIRIRYGFTVTRRWVSYCCCCCRLTTPVIMMSRCSQTSVRLSWTSWLIDRMTSRKLLQQLQRLLPRKITGRGWKVMFWADGFGCRKWFFLIKVFGFVGGAEDAAERLKHCMVEPPLRDVQIFVKSSHGENPLKFIYIFHDVFRCT